MLRRLGVPKGCAPTSDERHCLDAQLNTAQFSVSALCEAINLFVCKRFAPHYHVLPTKKSKYSPEAGI
jgi:hypothetical protein